MGDLQELELLRLACRVGRSGAWRWYVSEGRVDLTDEMYELFDLPTDTQIDLEIAMSLFNDESKTRLKSAIEECLKSGKPYDEVLVAKLDSGKTFQARATGFAVKDTAENVIALYGSLHDISGELKFPEQQFLSGNDLGYALQSIPDGLFVLDQQWRFTFVNKASEILLQKSTDDLQGKNIWDEFPEARGQKFEQVYRRVMETGGTETFIEYFEPLKTWFQVSAHRAPKSLVVHFRNVSKEIQRADKLGQSEERFRLIADTASDVLWDHDFESGFTWSSPGWPSKLGVDFDSERSQGFQWMDIVHPSDRQRITDEFVRAIRSDANRWETEFKVQNAQGQAIDLAVTASIIRRPNGRASRILGTTRNVTQERRTQEGYTRARALEAVGQLTGGVAHDFNNLLMIILGNVELLEMSHLGKEDAETVAGIAAAAESAALLTKQLLTFARQAQLNRSRVDVATMVSDTVPLLRAGLPETIRFSQSLAPDLWPVNVDANSLQQALINLAMNANDAMPRSGEVVVTCSNLEVDEDMVPATTDLRLGRYVSISVSDTGEGMAPEVLARAFEPFFTTKDVGEGTGLGLSTVYGFAKQSNGSVTIYSEPGRGTTVTLYLPAAEGDASKSDHPKPAIAAVMSKPCKRILVVEDQPQVRTHVEKTLARLGYAVETAQDAAAALTMLKQGEAFDLLFTDIIMPGGMNGQELGEAALQLAPQMKILYTSGYPAAAFEHLGLKEQSSINFLSKPYKTSQLQTMLAEILDDQSQG